MADMGVTEVTATSQEIIASVVQEVLKQKSLLLPTIQDYSSYAGKGADEVKIPRRTQFTADSKAENTSLTAQVLTFSSDTISLNKHKAVLARLEKIASTQSMVNVEAEIVKEMAAELALQVDKDIIVELRLVSTSAPDHLIDFSNSPTDTVTDTDFLEARRLLNVQNVDQSDRFCLLSPDREKEALALTNFISQELYGPNMAIMKGELGMVRGFRILLHNEVGDGAEKEIHFYHKSCVGYAFQQQPEFKRADDLPNVAEEMLLHQIYGCKILDSGKRGVMINASGA
jgi:N4-gp56 family major capsid protein